MHLQSLKLTLPKMSESYVDMFIHNLTIKLNNFYVKLEDTDLYDWIKLCWY